MTWAIIGINVAIWLYVAGSGAAEQKELLRQFAAYPSLIVHAFWPLGEDSARLAGTLVSSMFLHQDIEHVGLNMFFFHVFSRVVEYLMGSWRFAVFYLLCGLIGTLSHCFVNAQSMTPLIGASGAVAGVLAAHVLLLPWDRVRVASRYGSGTLPAWGFTAIWIFFQFVIASDSGSNVAWIAHLGGLAAGFALAPLFRRAGVPIFGESEGDVEPPSEEEKKTQPESAAAPRKDEPPPAPQGPAHPVPETTLLGVWAAGPVPPEEPAIPAIDLSRGWSAVIAVAALALVGWAWDGARADVDARAHSRTLEWQALAKLSGDVLRRDVERGMALYREAAELGEPDVQFRFAELLARGPAEAGRAEAWTWYKRAAEGGNERAMRTYAAALIEGKDVPRDSAAAAGFLAALVRLDYAWGALMQGHILENGIGVAADPKQAAERYKEGCNLPRPHNYTKEKSEGSALACYRLSLLLLAKKAPSEKPDDAKTYMRRAADNGLDDARNAYGLWLATGSPDGDDIGPAAGPDDADAYRHFSFAAGAGHADAMYNLARMLELKRPPYEGDQRSRIRALYETSAARGNAKAKAALERIKISDERKG